MDEKEKTCKNCKDYCEYYYIFHDHLKSAWCGYCVNAKTHYSKRQRKANDEICERFEPAEIKPTEQNQRIETVIRRMQRQLSQILMILKTE